MSRANKQSDNTGLFPPSWIVGPDAAAELARGDDEVMVAPELSEEDLRPLSGGRSEPSHSGSDAIGFDDIWTPKPAATREGVDHIASDATAFQGSGEIDATTVPMGISATRDDRDQQGPFSGTDEAVTLHTNEPDPAEINALWHDMDDLNARFSERERKTSRLRLEPTLSAGSLEATATGPVGRAYGEPETASLGIRFAAAVAVLLAVAAVGHRFDIPSADFWEQTDSWVVERASSAFSHLGSIIAND